jgi:VWFA-related protein
MKNLAWTVAAVILLLSVSLAQSPKEVQRPGQQKSAGTNTAPPESPQDDVEMLKIDTNLVTVPVIASSRTGQYITDLRKEEFKLSEDGVPQEIAFLATVNAPFYVVLLLDTSDSTRDSLPLIKRAAIGFLNLLGPRDRVKIISFDSKVKDWNDFTGDQTILRGAIEKTVTGEGTRVYDAMQLGLDMLRPIQQRKAIVLFTDGVDWHSESSTFESTSRDLDQSGVIVYPIRFETRDFTERTARQQQQDSSGGQLPTTSILRQPPTGTTQTTFPSDDPFPVPAQKRSSLPIPPPSVLLGRGRNPNPPNGSPTDPFPDSGPPSSSRRTLPDPDNPRTNRDRRENDTISGMLNNLYMMADSYLNEIADRSGGQVYRADNVASLPQAFRAIADELRTQYLLGYYPVKRDLDGSYRKIQVKTSRRDIAIRARPGYRARSGN